MTEYVDFVWYASTADTRVVPVIERHTGQIVGCGYLTTYAPPQASCVMTRVTCSLSMKASVELGSPRRLP